MEQPKNQAAWLLKADTRFQIDDAPMPMAGPGEIVVKNGATAVNTLDSHMQDIGVFIQQVRHFRLHTINLVSGRPQDGSFALYTVVPAEKAAIPPDNPENF